MTHQPSHPSGDHPPSGLPPATVRVYVDGPNLQHAFTEVSPWSVDLVSLVKGRLGCHLGRPVTISKFKYFSTPRWDSKEEHDAYCQLMHERHPKFDYIPGKYVTVEKRWAAQGKGQEPQRTRVLEEKMTDVNIAVSMVHDAHCNVRSGNNRFDWACLVSCDADQTMALKLTQSIGQPTILLSMKWQKSACELYRALQDKRNFVEVTSKTVMANLLPAKPEPDFLTRARQALAARRS